MVVCTVFMWCWRSCGFLCIAAAGMRRLIARQSHLGTCPKCPHGNHTTSITWTPGRRHRGSVQTL